MSLSEADSDFFTYNVVEDRLSSSGGSFEWDIENRSLYYTHKDSSFEDIAMKDYLAHLDTDTMDSDQDYSYYYKEGVENRCLDLWDNYYCNAVVLDMNYYIQNCTVQAWLCN